MASQPGFFLKSLLMGFVMARERYRGGFNFDELTQLFLAFGSLFDLLWGF